jgi:diguanylate cyclase (GGDEF)-like protein
MADPSRPAWHGQAAAILAGIAALSLAGLACGLALLGGPAAIEAHRHPLAAPALLALALAVGLCALALARRPSGALGGKPSTRDALTGLLNHEGFRDRLEETVAISRRQNWQIGLLVLNLRNFREVNEANGRAGGDRALGVIAGRLRGAVRREDLVARLSGDRFAVAQIALQDAADALRLAERLADLIARPLPLDGAVTSTAADIGIAIGPGDGNDAGLLLTRAEDALAAARNAPSPGICCFAPAQDAALRRRRQLERDLRDAVAEGGFRLHWQPQRCLANGRLIGFEALLRWPHPVHGMIPPDEFIPLAEATGLIVPLGAWVIRTAVAEAATWPAGLKVAVNLSVEQVKAEGLLDVVRDALAVSGMPPHRLELEVTESVLIEDSPQAARAMAGLQALGVSISLDDFGTGWSSLAYLRLFRFNELKIDRQFLRDLEADPRVETVVTAILGLGRGLGMRVVAEGVETREQADRLIALGCERGQGWLLGRPMPAEQARALIEAETTSPVRSAA